MRKIFITPNVKIFIEHADQKTRTKMEFMIAYLSDDKNVLRELYVRHISILKKADIVREISNHFFKSCYQKRNEWMVDRSNLVIAVFNGEPSGTKNTVIYAQRKGVEINNVLKN